MRCLDFTELSPLQELQFLILTTQWVPLVEQELLTLASRAHEFNFFVGGVRVAQSLVLCVLRCEPFVLSFFSDCIFSSSIYGSRLPLWYHQTFLVMMMAEYSIRIGSSHSRCQLTSSQINEILWHVNVKSFAHSTPRGSTIYSCTLKCLRHNKEFDLTWL